MRTILTRVHSYKIFEIKEIRVLSFFLVTKYDGFVYTRFQSPANSTYEKYTCSEKETNENNRNQFCVNFLFLLLNLIYQKTPVREDDNSLTVSPTMAYSPTPPRKNVFLIIKQNSLY